MSDGSSKLDRDHPFYIRAGCCTSCGVPPEIAPELFGWGEESCRLIRQPSTSHEVDKMVEVMWGSEFGCIRYGGDDIALLERLGQADLADFADNPSAQNFAVVDRDRVTFSLAQSHRPMRPFELAAAFRWALQGRGRYKFQSARIDRRSVSFAWCENYFNKVTFYTIEEHKLWMAVILPSIPDALKSSAIILHEWLMFELHAVDVTWHTMKSLATGDTSAKSPY